MIKKILIGMLMMVLLVQVVVGFDDTCQLIGEIGCTQHGIDTKAFCKEDGGKELYIPRCDDDICNPIKKVEKCRGNKRCSEISGIGLCIPCYVGKYACSDYNGDDHDIKCDDEDPQKLITYECNPDFCDQKEIKKSDKYCENGELKSCEKGKELVCSGSRCACKSKEDCRDGTTQISCDDKRGGESNTCGGGNTLKYYTCGETYECDVDHFEECGKFRLCDGATCKDSCREEGMICVNPLNDNRLPSQEMIDNYNLNGGNLNHYGCEEGVCKKQGTLVCNKPYQKMEPDGSCTDVQGTECEDGKAGCLFGVVYLCTKGFKDDGKTIKCDFGCGENGWGVPGCDSNNFIEDRCCKICKDGYEFEEIGGSSICVMQETRYICEDKKIFSQEVSIDEKWEIVETSGRREEIDDCTNLGGCGSEGVYVQGIISCAKEGCDGEFVIESIDGVPMCTKPDEEYVCKGDKVFLRRFSVDVGGKEVSSAGIEVQKKDCTNDGGCGKEGEVSENMISCAVGEEESCPDDNCIDSTKFDCDMGFQNLKCTGKNLKCCTGNALEKGVVMTSEGCEKPNYVKCKSPYEGVDYPDSGGCYESCINIVERKDCNKDGNVIFTQYIIYPELQSGTPSGHREYKSGDYVEECTGNTICKNAKCIIKETEEDPVVTCSDKNPCSAGGECKKGECIDKCINHNIGWGCLSSTKKLCEEKSWECVPDQKLCIKQGEYCWSPGEGKEDEEGDFPDQCTRNLASNSIKIDYADEVEVVGVSVNDAEHVDGKCIYDLHIVVKHRVNGLTSHFDEPGVEMRALAG